jgi:radical SAM protein with 4Fe4S-binding SPASM domain
MSRARHLSPGQFHIPDSLLLQWHITSRCNLRCAHCYQNAGHENELGMEGWRTILHQYLELLSVWRDTTGRWIAGHITVTGGDPFMRPDFMDLLQLLAAHRRDFSFAILTNGTRIDDAVARRLKNLGPTYVQVSLEGSRQVHDEIRGKGNHDRTVEAIQCLLRAGLYTSISFTAHRDNVHTFPEVALLGRHLRVSRIWSDRLIPYGSAAAMKERLLAPEEVKHHFESMYGLRRKEGLLRFFRKDRIVLNRALQFLVGGGRPYSCLAGDRLVTVMPDGDLLPCRRMPVAVGNLLRSPLAKLYYTSAFFLKLRDRSVLDAPCRRCAHGERCRGGLRCLSYALHKDPFRKDPGCWLTP